MEQGDSSGWAGEGGSKTAEVDYLGHSRVLKPRVRGWGGVRIDVVVGRLPKPMS
jgi:hypothetical protein